MRVTTYLSLLLVGFFGVSAARATVVKNISTGIDDSTGLQLVNNAPDTDYTIATGSSSNVGATPIARSTPLPAPYLTDASSTASRWIAINSGSGLEGISVAAGDYFFQTTVNLTGFLASTAIIPSLRYASDDELVSLAINGTPVFSQPQRGTDGEFFGFNQLSANLGAGLFQDGSNTISFEVYNVVGDTALRVEGSVTASVPEPASLLMALPLSFLLAMRRKHKVKKRGQTSSIAAFLGWPEGRRVC
jgi:hypothetical protein